MCAMLVVLCGVLLWMNHRVFATGAPQQTRVDMVIIDCAVVIITLLYVREAVKISKR
jgi:hypothetical protein